MVAPRQVLLDINMTSVDIMSTTINSFHILCLLTLNTVLVTNFLAFIRILFLMPPLTILHQPYLQKAEDLPNIRDALVVSRLAGYPARQSGHFNIRPFMIYLAAGYKGSKKVVPCYRKRC